MFTYHMPTKIYAGESALLQNADALILGARAMIVTGKTSGKASGALSDVLAVLEARGIPSLVYDKIENNPTIESTAEGGRAAAEFGADFLIGIGGGSPLDAAKAIAVYAQNPPCEGSPFQLYDIFGGVFKNRPLPMAAIPTTAGTGSETTPYSILTLHDIENKKSFSSPEVFYKVAFLDGRYTENLPLQVARNTAVDALCHLWEGFTCRRASLASDYIALEGLRLLGRQLAFLENGKLSLESRTLLLWAACLGGIVISQTGTTIVHSMGYPLTYYKNIPHGLANGLLLGEYLRRANEVCPEKIRQGLAAMGLSDLDALCAYLAAILPRPAAVFTPAELTGWSEKTILAKNAAACPFPVTAKEELAIFTTCLL